MIGISNLKSLQIISKIFNMFEILYSFLIKIYNFLAILLSKFNKKINLWVKGRKNLLSNIKKANISETRNIWFHAASLGEFEQARPLIESIKKQYPYYKIVLTFFSPSGYEIRKDYKFADYVWYLPTDSKKNSKFFIKYINPEKVFFIKYDFWYFYLKTLSENKIPTYLVSGIFRKNQIFFKSYAKKYSAVLGFFNHLFVQNEVSANLLKNISVKNVTITGDTRFDRVISIAEKSENIDIVENFITNKQCIIAGSTWTQDEILLTKFINRSYNIKFIIAPHEVAESNIINLLKMINRPVIRYSRAKDTDLSDYQVLIIDNIGLLASVYKYANIAYIGGGFGAGIHNILEAAVFGVPIIFGPKHSKFKEAEELIQLKAAFSIKTFDDLKKYFELFLNDHNFMEATSEKSRKYVYKNKGATMLIMKHVFN